jgi:xyloglucan-specific exo-beta-1,4-glucanase
LGAPASGGTHAGISFVLFDPRSGIEGGASRTIFVGVADPGGPHLYGSDDAGASWQPVAGEPQAGLLPVRAQLDSRGALYIAYCNAMGPNGISAGAVYRLNTDTGRWRDISPPAPTGLRGGFMGLALSTTAPGTVLIGTLDWWSDRDTIFRSTDAGEHWTDLRSRSQVDASATPFLRWGDTRASFGWWLTGIAVDPFDDAHVAYTTGATVLTTDAVTAPSVQWRPWVQDMEETAVLTLASPSQGPPLLSGFGDIGGFVHEDLQVSPSTMYLQPQFNNTVDIEVAAQAPHIVIRSGTPRRGGASIAWSETFGHSWAPLDVPAQARPTPAVAVSADGSTFIISQGGVWLTHDRGTHWIRAQGLADNLRIVADQVDSQRFYAVDLLQSRLMVSDDGGEHFGAVVSRGLPQELTRTCRPERGSHAPLFATPGRLEDLWMTCHDALYHSLDGGRRFQSMAGDLTITELAFGKAAAPDAYPTLFAIGMKNGQRAIWRSDNGASSWFRINDDAHQYGGRFRAISGDPRVFGRVYLGTDGRGLVYGEPSLASPRLAMGR